MFFVGALVAVESVRNHQLSDDILSDSASYLLPRLNILQFTCKLLVGDLGIVRCLGPKPITVRETKKFAELKVSVSRY